MRYRSKLVTMRFFSPTISLLYTLISLQRTIL